MLSSLLAAETGHSVATSPLTAAIVAPFVGAAVVALIPKGRAELHRLVALLFAVGTGAITLWLLAAFDTNDAGFQFEMRRAWITDFGISWHLGIDGISLFLVVLSGLLFPLAIVAVAPHHDPKPYYAWLLILQGGCIGVFCALDLFLFFVMFEIVLVPMYFLIGGWGYAERVYAALKFFLYTAFGSALLLAALIALALAHGRQTGNLSFAYTDLIGLELGQTESRWLFAAFALAFAIKVPIFPFHTWLPDAHVEAPTAGSVLLAGVLLKLGTYGLLRFNLSLFPEVSVEAVPIMATLAVIGIVYGAVVAIVQPDLKKLVAYSSVSHLGFIVLGIFAFTSAGLQGAVIQNINHGLTTGALFLLVGMLYERRHTKKIAEFGGIGRPMPIFAGLFLFATFASIGLPALNGFVGEFLVLIGAFPTVPVHAIIAASGVVLAAIYLLWAYERVFTGEPDKAENKALIDVSGREIALMAPLVVLIVLLGVYPNILLDRTAPSTEAVLDRIEASTDFVVPAPGRLADVFIASEEDGE